MMVKKTVGYVELEWVCPNCESRNRGTRKVCTSCGAAQPDDVEFIQAAEEKLISDEAEIASAKAAPDIHCGYCGTRNPSTAEKCKQCGGDLTEGAARESGRVMGAHRAGPAGEALCPQCGAPNPATALECSQCGGTMHGATPARPAPRPKPAAAQPKRKIGLAGIIGIGAVVLIALTFCVLIILSLLPSDELNGTVQSASWERSVQVEELRDVTREAWQDEIPAGATPGACTDKVHHTQPDPAPRAVEVCGTPYTVDTGTGHGEVVQDCEYQVYDDWCEYTTKDWIVVDTLVLSGSDLAPRWPDVGASTDRREGEREAVYHVVLVTEDKTFTHTLSDVDRFRQFAIGSRWVVQTNKLGGIQSIEPAE
jgi:ribosomal protein L40E